MERQEELRQAIEQLAKRGRGKRYPDALRKELITYILARREAGGAVETIGEELGMSWRTVSRWTAPKSKRGKFRPVKVVQEGPDQKELTLLGPCGVRVEGIRPEQVAEVLRRLT